MKLHLQLTRELITKLNLDNCYLPIHQSSSNEEVSISANNEDDANYIACEIIPELMWLSPTYEYQTFYTMLNVILDEYVEDCAIYFQSDVEDLINGSHDDQLFYHFMDENGLLDGDLTAFINENLKPLNASLRFVD